MLIDGPKRNAASTRRRVHTSEQHRSTRKGGSDQARASARGALAARSRGTLIELNWMDPAQSGPQLMSVLTCFPGRMARSHGSRQAAEAMEGMDCEAVGTTVHWQAGSGRLGSSIQSWKTKGMKCCADASHLGSTGQPHRRNQDKLWMRADCESQWDCDAAMGRMGPACPQSLDPEQRLRLASRAEAVDTEQRVPVPSEGKVRTLVSCWSQSHRIDGGHRGLRVAAAAAAAVASAAVVRAIRRSLRASTGHHQSSRATTRRPLADGTCTGFLGWCLCSACRAGLRRGCI